MEGQSTEFFWKDNFPVVFTMWDSNEPSTPTNANGCTQLNTNGRWAVASDCATAKPFICKIELHENPSGPGDDMGDAKCDPGWDIFTGSGAAHCYRQYIEAQDSYGAYATCNAHGAYPISIHSEYELKFAQSLSGHANTWLGAGLANGGGPDAITGWTWVDGSSFNFVNWADGEPSGPADTEQCIEMWTNGLWNDNSCDKVSPKKLRSSINLIFDIETSIYLPKTSRILILCCSKS